MLFATGLTALVAASAGNAATTITRGEAQLLQAMNRTRAAHGLVPLRVDPRLVRAARAYSRTLIARDVFTHGSFAARLTAYGVRGPVVGENLAWGVGTRATPAAIVRQWLASPGHRRNLLRPGFRRVGIGAPYGSFAGYANARVVTADFAGR